MASLFDRVLHKHKARSTGELVARAGSALDKLGIGGAAVLGGQPGGPPTRSGSGSGDGGGLALPLSPATEKLMDEVGRLLAAMKVRAADRKWAPPEGGRRAGAAGWRSSST
jgi:hypothetical protein